MASAYNIKLSLEDTGVFKIKNQDEETAAKASELLQQNHEKHDLFFNKSGFHNHIVHHLLTLYALGAPASVIEKQYAANLSYQRPPYKVNEENVKAMSDPKKFMELSGPDKDGNPDKGADFLTFFQREIEGKGVEAVLKEYLFAGDERAEDFLVRMYSGFLHPIIHLGFGLEFSQPSIVAEALAQGACHDNRIGSLFFESEKLAKDRGPSSKSLPGLLEEIYNDKKLSTAASWDDSNKVLDGILARAPSEAIKYCSQYTVSPSQLEEKTAEMMATAIYYTACAQHPPKQVKMDFYFMHCVNSSIFWSTFNALPYITPEQKARLLEWKGRLDLAMYASRRSPKLYLEEVATYVPKELERGEAEWNGIFGRLFKANDDGHAVKLARAVAHAEKVCGAWENSEWARIKGFMWEKIGNMVVDSVEDEGATWARSVGFEEAWAEYKDRPRQAHI